jgi:GR25 family glycosyltransferase involved in LPS biosynthesis
LQNFANSKQTLSVDWSSSPARFKETVCLFGSLVKYQLMLNGMCILLYSFLLLFECTFSESLYKAYVINIPSRTDRLESISTQLRRNGIPFEIQRAITPADLKAESLAISRNTGRTGLFHLETSLNFSTAGSFISLRRSEVGCFQSHLQVLFKISDSKTEAPVLIVEDDAMLSPNFYNQTERIINDLPHDWDIFHVGYCFRLRCDESGPRSREFCRIKRFRLWCLQAYFVNGSRAAKKAVEVINTASPGGKLDSLFYKTTENYYASVSVLARQLFSFGSDNGNSMTHWKE